MVFRVVKNEPRVAFSVACEACAVVEPSSLSFTVDGVDLLEGVEIDAVDRYHVNETYPWRGVHSEVNLCEGTRISLKHTGSGTDYALEVRAFNDGVAFRLDVWFLAVMNGPAARTVDVSLSFLEGRTKL